MGNTGTATVFAFRFLPLLIVRLIFGLKIRSGHKASLNANLNSIALALGNLVLIYGISSDLVFNLLHLVSSLLVQPTTCKEPE